MQKDKDTGSIPAVVSGNPSLIVEDDKNAAKLIGAIRQVPANERASRSYSRLICRLVFLLFFLCLAGPARAQDAPPAPFGPDEIQHGFSQFDTIPAAPEDMAPDPMDYYKNPAPDSSGLPDETPGGLFLHITLAESFEEDLDFRRGHRYYPINPTQEFHADALAVHVVFRVFKHYSAYQVIGRLFPENVPGFSGDTFTDEETAYLALEDESGYLKFFAPSQNGWIPGAYRVDIFVGFEANDVTRMGTLRFTVTPKA